MLFSFCASIHHFISKVLLIHWHWVHILSTIVLFWEFCLYIDGSTIVQPPGGQSVPVTHLNWCLYSLNTIYFLNDININIVTIIIAIMITIKLSMLLLAIKNKKGTWVRLVGQVTDSMVNKHLWSHLSVTKINKLKSQWIWHICTCHPAIIGLILYYFWNCPLGGVDI